MREQATKSNDIDYMQASKEISYCVAEIFWQGLGRVDGGEYNLS